MEESLRFRIDVDNNWIVDASEFGYPDGAARSITISDLIKIRDRLSFVIEEMTEEQERLDFFVQRHNNINN